MLSTFREVYARKGLTYLIYRIIRRIVIYSLAPFYYVNNAVVFRDFDFLGRRYRYFLRFYNFTWRSEREVEIPIVWGYVQQYKGKKILEVGNVLSHYFNTKHDVLDKYEIAPNVINEDVVNFNPRQLYDLIVSISTLEHVGWDETPRNPYKFVTAIDNLKRCLNADGQMVITAPLGQNEVLERFIQRKMVDFSEIVIMRRISFNRWRCSQLPSKDKIRPNNTVLIGIIKKSS